MSIENARRGRAAIEAMVAEAAARKSEFRPFIPQIRWREDQEKKFLLFLTPVDGLYRALYHDWIHVGSGEKANGETFKRYEDFISRKDPMIGEDYDDLDDRLDVEPKDRFLGVAVELEPIMEDQGGRLRPVGFSVAVETFTRRTEDGDDEEVTMPKVGLVIQAYTNFYRYLTSFDAETAPMNTVPFLIKRGGKDKDTGYDFIHHKGDAVDLSPLMEHIDGVGYLAPEMDELRKSFETCSSFEETAELIGEAILTKRIQELIDGERYHKYVDPLTHVESKFGKRADRKNKDKRTEQRPASSPEVEAAPEPTPEQATTEEPKASRAERFAALRAMVEAQKTAA